MSTDYYAKDLTKREYFAGLLYANADIKNSWSQVDRERGDELDHYKRKAREAVKQADALLAELEAAGDPLEKK